MQRLIHLSNNLIQQPKQNSQSIYKEQPLQEVPLNQAQVKRQFAFEQTAPNNFASLKESYYDSLIQSQNQVSSPPSVNTTDTIIESKADYKFKDSQVFSPLQNQMMNSKSATKIRSSLRKSGYQSANFAASLINSPQQSHRKLPQSSTSEIQSNYSLISTKQSNDLRGSFKHFKNQEGNLFKNNGASLRKYIVSKKDQDINLRSLANRYENNYTTNSNQTHLDSNRSPFRTSATQTTQNDISIRTSIQKKNQKNNSQSSSKLRHYSVQNNKVNSIDRKLATEASDYESMLGASFKNGQARVQIQNLRGSINHSNLSGSNKTFDLRQCLPQLTDTTTNITRMGADEAYANAEDLDREYFSKHEEAQITRSDYSPQINCLNQEKLQSKHQQRLSRKGIQQQIYDILKKQNGQLTKIAVQLNNHEKVTPSKARKSSKKRNYIQKQASNLKHFDGCIPLEDQKIKSKIYDQKRQENTNYLYSQNQNRSNLMFQNTEKNLSKSGMWTTLMSPTGQSESKSFSIPKSSSKSRQRSSSNKSTKLQGYNYKDQSVKIHGDQETKQIILTIDKKLHDCQENKKIIEGRYKKQLLSPQNLIIDQRPLSPKSLSSFLSPQAESCTPQFSTNIKGFEKRYSDNKAQCIYKGEARQAQNQQVQTQKADVIELLKNTLRKNQKDKELNNFLKENYYSPQSQKEDQKRRESYADKGLKKKLQTLNQSKNSQKNTSKSGKKKQYKKSYSRKMIGQKHPNLQDKTSQMFSNFYQNILANVVQDKKSSLNDRKSQFTHDIEDVNQKLVYLENVRLKKEIEQLKQMMKTQNNNQDEFNQMQLHLNEQVQIQNNLQASQEQRKQSQNYENFDDQNLFTRKLDQREDNCEVSLAEIYHFDQIERQAAEKKNSSEEMISQGKQVQEPTVHQHCRSYS